MSVYRAPFPTPQSRRPTWRFPNELPIAGEPAGVYSTIEKAHRALAQSSYPKLLFAGNPGALISPAFAESFAKELKNCRVVQLSSGIHYLQEDHPDVIGANVKEWLIEIGSCRRSSALQGKSNRASLRASEDGWSADCYWPVFFC